MSGGEQQMLALARALMPAPKILLIDEPSVGLALVLVKRTIEKIQELKERYQLTVLMAEQNFNQAVRIADRGDVIVHGRDRLRGRLRRRTQADAGCQRAGPQILPWAIAIGSAPFRGTPRPPTPALILRRDFARSDLLSDSLIRPTGVSASVDGRERNMAETDKPIQLTAHAIDVLKERCILERWVVEALDGL